MLKLVTLLTLAAIAQAGRLKLHHKKIFPEVKIVGGHDTDIKDHPWQVSLRWYDFHVCGGSLIGNKWIITAAHCTEYFTPNELTVKVGSTFQSSGGTVYEVDRFIVHPDANDYDFDNDIAILELKQYVDDPNASFINLPSQGETLAANTNLNVTGWGDTEQGSEDGYEILQEVTVPVVSNDECASAYAGLKITKGMLCAGFLGVGGKDACQGDSGGPAAIGSVLYGIVSWGNGCASPRYPGVYTNVANYADWVKKATGL